MVLAGAEVLVLVRCIEVVQSRCRGGASAKVVQRCQCAKVWSRGVSIMRRRRRGGSSLG